MRAKLGDTVEIRLPMEFMPRAIWDFRSPIVKTEMLVLRTPKMVKAFNREDIEEVRRLNSKRVQYKRSF